MSHEPSNEERIVRAFEPSDESAVVQVWQRAGAVAYASWTTPFTLEQTADVFRRSVLGKCRIFVGTRDGEIVAFIAITDSTIARLYVDPSHWRQGWGTRLVESAKELSTGGLTVATDADDEASCGVYERCGFRAVGYYPGESGDSPHGVTYEWRAETRT
jgi:ribosomal protein S18 acetylase RimI-like enzyme